MTHRLVLVCSPVAGDRCSKVLLVKLKVNLLGVWKSTTNTRISIISGFYGTDQVVRIGHAVIRFLSLAEQQKQLPPPTGLKRNWWDAITVDISWEKPHNFSAEAGIYYKYKIADKEVRFIVHLLGILV